jgi:hypothetical protein
VFLDGFQGLDRSVWKAAIQVVDQNYQLIDPRRLQQLIELFAESSDLFSNIRGFTGRLSKIDTAKIFLTASVALVRVGRLSNSP